MGTMAFFTYYDKTQQANSQGKPFFQATEQELNSHHLQRTIHIINIVRYHAVGSLTVHVSFTMCPKVKRSSSAKNIINIGRYHAVGSLTVRVSFTMCPKVKQSSLAKNIINVTECIVYMFRAMTL